MQTAKSTFLLSQPQTTALRSKAPVVLFLAGLGAGKTTALAIRLLMFLTSHSGAVMGVFAPSRKVLNRTTLAGVRRIWDLMGYSEGRDYVINRRPPASWRVKPYSPLNASGVLTTRNGSYCVLDGLENFDSQRGAEFDAVLIDEFRDCREGVFEVISGRMRGKVLPQRQIFIYTTPPENPDILTRIISLRGTELVTATSYSNASNLPAGYLDLLKSNYSTVAFRREVMAELIPAKINPFAYAFDASRHVGECAFNPKLEVYLSFDFNISPATCTAWHVDHWAMQACCLREFRLTNASIYALLDVIKAAFPRSIFYVTGDATGKARLGASAELKSFYDIILSELGLSREFMATPMVNATHRSSSVLVNSVLEKCNIKIDKSCVYLIRDLETVNYDPATGGIDKKDLTRGHLLDTMRYLFHTYFANFVNIIR